MKNKNNPTFFGIFQYSEISSFLYPEGLADL